MARSDLLRQLFASYSRGDDAAFRRTATEIITDERHKNHRLLAAELEDALHRDLKPGAQVPLTLRPIPKSRDDRPLLRLSKPERDFDDLVLGTDTTEVLQEIVAENQRRSVLTSHCLRPRQRLLLVGPSGTGKTASAHAVAAELSLPVATASLAALSSSYLGETGRNVEAVMQFAEQTPCVLVFDEFDVLAQERAQASDHGEIRRVAAVVLQLLEGLKGESLVIATSNHPQLVDVAMWRRFDEVVPFSALNVNKIATLIGLRLQAVEHSISTQSWARKLRTASPAEVELVCVDAMRRTVLAGSRRVDDDAMSAAVARLRSRNTALKRVAAGTSAATGDPPNQT
jgi:SpoVK/Ycf46/Vps4 family AAA+-type ATPase